MVIIWTYIPVKAETTFWKKKENEWSLGLNAEKLHFHHLNILKRVQINLKTTNFQHCQPLLYLQITSRLKLYLLKLNSMVLTPFSISKNSLNSRLSFDGITPALTSVNMLMCWPVSRRLGSHYHTDLWNAWRVICEWILHNANAFTKSVHRQRSRQTYRHLPEKVNNTNHLCHSW